MGRTPRWSPPCACTSSHRRLPGLLKRALAFCRRTQTRVTVSLCRRASAFAAARPPLPPRVRLCRCALAFAAARPPLHSHSFKFLNIQTIIFDMSCTCCVYTVHILTNLFCQGNDSAPGLDIMLPKQQHLSVSGQAANPARQHPPVEYVFPLYVGRVNDFLCQVPLITCFLDGNATSTIPHKYSGRQRDAFECCCAYGAGPTTRRGSHVY